MGHAMFKFTLQLLFREITQIECISKSALAVNRPLLLRKAFFKTCALKKLNSLYL